MINNNYVCDAKYNTAYANYYTTRSQMASIA